MDLCLCVGNRNYSSWSIIWCDQPRVRAVVARIEAAWAECLDLSGGPFLCGAFSALDAYFAPIVMRLKYYGLPT